MGEWMVVGADGTEMGEGMAQVDALLRARELRMRQVRARVAPPADYELTVECDATDVRPTTTGVDGAVDVELTVTIGEDVCPVETTLVRDHTGDWATWGSLDNWLDGGTIAWLEMYPSDARDEIVTEIGRAACRAAEAA